jgi:hypothetical protein
MASPTKKQKKIKLPRTCFVIFRSAQNADIKKNHPGLDFGEISKEIARRWKSLTVGGREKWMEKAKEEKIAWEQQHGPVQKYKQLMAAEQDAPDAREKREVHGKAKFSPYALFKRAYLKRWKAEQKQAHENGDKRDSLRKDQLESLCQSKWKALSLEEKAEYEEKSRKKFSTINCQNKKSGTRWLAAEGLEDPVLGRFPVSHVLQFCHCVWQYIDKKSETNMGEGERPEQINWNIVASMLANFPLCLKWTPHECQQVWKFIAYGQSPSRNALRNDTMLEDSDVEDIRESIGEGDFPVPKISQKRKAQQMELQSLSASREKSATLFQDSGGVRPNKDGHKVHEEQGSIIASPPRKTPKSPTMDDIRILALGAPSFSDKPGFILADAPQNKKSNVTAHAVTTTASIVSETCFPGRSANTQTAETEISRVGHGVSRPKESTPSDQIIDAGDTSHGRKCETSNTPMEK